MSKKKPSKGFKIIANEKIDEAIKLLLIEGERENAIKILEEAKKLNEADQKEAIDTIESIAAKMGEDGQMRLSGTMAVIVQVINSQLPPVLSEKVKKSIQKALAKMDNERNEVSKG
jgi:hypothetical protein